MLLIKFNLIPEYSFNALLIVISKARTIAITSDLGLLQIIQTLDIF